MKFPQLTGLLTARMKTVKIKKSELLTKVVKNRNRHKELYEEAHAAYLKKAVREFGRLAALAKTGRKFPSGLQFHAPTDYTRKYDDAIAMLRMDVEDVVELTEMEFAQLVLDQWQWQRDWVMSNSGYSSKISKLARNFGE